MRKRKIMYVSGTRADFELMKGTLKEINRNPNLKLILVVTGMHLLKSRGSTLNDIKHEFKVSRIIRIMKEKSNSNLDMAYAIGKCIIGISKIINEAKPDMILVEGDRIEALGTAIAGAVCNIPIFHVSGGDITQSIDDSIRHALTKISHIHLPGTKKSADRILKMGEEPWRVHLVGAPINKEAVKKKDLEKEIGTTISRDTLLVIQHPVSTQSKYAGKQMKETMKAINELNHKSIVIYPNTDAGSEDMIKVIKKYRGSKNIHVFKNLKGNIFMSLLKNVGVIVGNSSAGIAEAPLFNTPCVNIGIREEGREQAGNVINTPHNKKLIADAIKRALSKKFRDKVKKSKNPYNSNNVEKRIIKVLLNTKIDSKLINKKLTY